MLCCMQWWMLRKRLHVSWLIAVMSAAIVMGVMSAQWLAGWSSVVWCFVAVGLAAIGFWRRAVYVVPLIVFAGLLLGLWRGSIDQNLLAVYEKLYGASALVTGKVTDDPDVGKSGETLLRLSDVTINGHEVAGGIWVSASTKADIKRGDIATVKGVLKEGFGSFAASMYRSQLVKVERPEPGDVARQVRDWFADAVRMAVPEPQASLGIGYLVGQRRALPPELSEALVIAGLTHIVVASGYNLTILVRLARRLFVGVSKYLNYIQT